MNYLPNLLIVDDSEENLVFLEKVVRKLEVNLIKALSGPEALDKIRGMELALAIIDVRMPGMNGYELAMKMNGEGTGSKVPIIFLTASHVSEMQIFEGYGSGAVDYIFKPINNHVLLCKINVFLDLFNQKLKIISDAALLKKSAEVLTRVNAALRKGEEKYRSYIDNAPDGVFVADETGRYIEVNEAASRITGYSKEELLGMTIADILPESSARDGLSHFNILKNNGSAKADMLFRHKNGTLRWWAVEAVSLGETRFIGFAKDITERKVMEAALRSSQIELEMQNEELSTAFTKAESATRRYTELYDFAPSGYFTLNNENAIQELNHSGARILGKDRSSLIGSHFGAFTSEESLPVYDNFFQAVFKSKTKQICELILGSREHAPRYVHVEGLVTENGKHCLLNVIDITERKMAENVIRDRESNLAEAQRIARMGSWEWDMVTDKVKWSAEMYRVFDLDPDEYDDRPESIINRLHPDDVESFTASMESNRSKGDTQSLEYRVIHKNGSVHHLNADGRMDFDKTGKPVKGIGTVQDITERKMAEQAIKVSEEKYKTMLNASPDGILLIDLNGSITEVSEIGLELFGADTREDLVGKDFHQFVQPDDREILQEIIEKTMTEGLAQNVELKIRKKNQSLFAGETSTTLIQGPGGMPLAFMIIIRDISHRKKMETKQIHADRMANLGEMASGIAHEINQPLNTISLAMDNILYEAAKDENIGKEYLKKKLDRIFENITRIRNIIDHVRAFSRSHDDYILTGFDINTSIYNAISMISEQYKHQAITLNLKLEENLPYIIGNTFKFEQVILNLLSNAKDALLDKKSKQSADYDMTVGIRSFLENQRVIIEMIDNGSGISDQDIEHIMLPFYTTKDAGKGTGLGLSISYQIVKDMNGTIEVSRNELNETIFRIVLKIQNRE